MNTGTYIFAQITTFIPRTPFITCTQRYNGEHYVKRLSCRDQLLTLMFGQLAYRDSLRDVIACLDTHQ